MITFKYMSNSTLLVTSCVYVSAPFVQLDDAEKRIKLTLESVKKWVNIFNNKNYIVLCDGSGYDFSGDIAKLFPDQKIECLFFHNDIEKVKIFGKGYGEGEIIKFALDNSKYLKSSDYFIKCTSKLFVENILEILKNWNNSFQCEFKFTNLNSIKKVKTIYIDTRFYIISKEFYKKIFYDAYTKVNDFDKYYLEHSFKDCFLKSKINIAACHFPIEPLIYGVSGSTGEFYTPVMPSKTQTVKRMIRRLILRLNHHFYRQI